MTVTFLCPTPPPLQGGSGALPAPPGFSTIPSKVASSDSLSSKLPSKSESLTEKSGPGGGREGGSGGKTTKPKFVPLMSAEGKSRVAMHLPGRHACQCLAQKHALVNNCLECGRIVCAQVRPPPPTPPPPHFIPLHLVTL